MLEMQAIKQLNICFSLVIIFRRFTKIVLENSTVNIRMAMTYKLQLYLIINIKDFLVGAYRLQINRGLNKSVIRNTIGLNYITP